MQPVPRSARPSLAYPDVYIGRLRKKLGPCGEPIATVRGAGYRYTESNPGDFGAISRA
ncbi:MAG: winged helix-turn-helix domain-containing protein [Thiocapsa sp.]|nr:MAG: winged helix-turn-helix domain-containing protein [Thiocapsa sp.]